MSIEDPEPRKKKLNVELADDGLAMSAIMARLFQNGTVGTTGPETWLLPAFENELVVYFINPENEMRIAYPILPFDCNISNGPL